MRHSLDSNRTSDKHLNAKNVCLDEIEFHVKIKSFSVHTRKHRYENLSDT